jgi:hypothetical protein
MIVACTDCQAACAVRTLRLLVAPIQEGDKDAGIKKNRFAHGSLRP